MKTTSTLLTCSSGVVSWSSTCEEPQLDKSVLFRTKLTWDSRQQSHVAIPQFVCKSVEIGIKS